MKTSDAPSRARTPAAGALRGPAARTALACLASALAACSLGTGAETPAAAPPPSPPVHPTLEVVEGAVVQARLEPGDRHVFPFDLEEGTYLEVRVDRPERELRIALFDSQSDTKPYVTGERATGHGEQMLWEVTRTSGEHQLVVSAPDDAVAYSLEVTDLRPATERDWSRHRGMRMFEEGQLQQDQQRPKEALERFQKARTLFEQGEYERGIAATYSKQGAILLQLGRRDEARAAYLASAEHWRLGGSVISEVNALARLAEIDRDAGQWESAAKHLERAEARALEEDDEAAQARVHYNHCRQHRSQRLLNRALDACERSLQISEKLEETGHVIATLNELGLVQSDLGELDQARATYLRALDLLESRPNAHQEATLRNNLAIVYQAGGQYLQALAYYEDALAHHESVGATAHAARVYFNMGTAYARLGDLEDTLEYYAEALARMKAAGDKIGHIEVLHGLVWARREIGDLEEAQRILDRALELSRGNENQYLEAYSLQQRGELDLDLGKPEAALQSLEAARTLYEGMEFWWQVAAVLRKIAAAHAGLGDFERAISTLRDALDITQDSGKRSGSAESLYRIALLEREQGHLEAANQAISEALAVVEEVRGAAGTEDIQTQYSATVKHYYDLKIDLLIDEHLEDPAAGHDARALLESERSKAQSLREIIVEANLRLDAEVPEELQAERDELQSEVDQHARLRRLLVAEKTPDPDRLSRVQVDLERSLIRLQEVERRIREASPRYAALTDPEPVSTREIQSSLLDSDTALLEYNLGETRSILWLVTQSSHRTYLLPGRRELERDARCVHRLIRAYGSLPSPDELARDRDLDACLGPQANHYRSIDPSARGTRVRARRRQEIEFAFHRVAAELSQALLGDAMRDEPLPLRLAVVSDGALEYVPFAALPIPTGDAQSRLVVDRHEIVRLPSASVLAVQRAQHRGRDAKPPGLVAIVADPVYGPDDPRLDAVSIDPAPSQLLPDEALRGLELLPVSRRRLDLSGYEAKTISSLVPTDRSLLIDGFDATPERVSGRALGDYLYVHFATHGEIDTEYPKLSSLVLSQVDRAGRRVEDGHLRLQDIYGMDLDDVDMVVLSACETALGKEVRGEGLMGLTRGFLYAGAERVAATLWQVQDVMTAELMEHFYRGLFEEDRAPAEALRHAQLAVRDSDEGDYSFPYYWAGFVLQGEWR